jgi:hypothetical protein
MLFIFKITVVHTYSRQEKGAKWDIIRPSIHFSHYICLFWKKINQMFDQATGKKKVLPKMGTNYFYTPSY